MRADGRNLVELHGMVLRQLMAAKRGFLTSIEIVKDENYGDKVTCWLGEQDLPAGWCKCVTRGDPCGECRGVEPRRPGSLKS